MKKRIAIINNLPGSLGDYCTDQIADFFTSHFDITRLDALENPLPVDPSKWVSENNISYLLIAGSLHSPLDPDKWIRGQEQFIRDYIIIGKPLFGICFGHEIIASALGGTLEYTGSLLVEAQDIEILSPHPLFKGFGSATRQVVAHSVQVTEAPPGFQVIGRTPDCPVQVMIHNELPVCSVQFHPEAGAQIKIHDPDWNPITDHDMNNHQGPALMKNYLEMLLDM